MNKKTILIGGISAACVCSFVLGASADGLIDTITAQIRPDYTIVYQDKVQTFQNVNGETVQPILYEGTTYLPLRAVSNLFGAEVFWNEEQKMIVLSQPQTAAETEETDTSETDTDKEEKDTDSNKQADKTDAEDTTDTDKEDTTKPTNSIVNGVPDIEKLTETVDSITETIDKLPASSNNTKRYKEIAAQIDDAENKCTVLDTSYQNQYQAGTLEKNTYHSNHNALQVLQARLKSLQKRLDFIFEK